MAALGLAIVLVGLGAIAVPPESFHAPRWVLALCGAICALSGLALLAQPDSGMRTALGGIIAAALGVGAGWVALFGESESFAGGVPFLPDGVNVGGARGLFGLGAAVGAALFVYGVRQLVRARADPEPPVRTGLGHPQTDASS